MSKKRSFLSIIKSKQTALVLRGIACIFACFMIVEGTIYAWYTSNENSNISGFIAEVKDSAYLEFGENCVATKTALDRVTTTNTYKKNSSNRLVLQSSITKDVEGNEIVEEIKNTNFLFNDMLPGEYVDITVNIVTRYEEALNFSIALADFDVSHGTFEIPNENGDDITYDILGAFKYKPIEIEYFSDDYVTSISKVTFDTNYQWINTYQKDVDSVAPSQVKVLDSLEWKANYKCASLTFRISEDFTQYYDLVSQINTSVTNLLSEKQFEIGTLQIITN